MTVLAEIDSQPISTLVCSYFVCPSCSIVDDDWGRMKRGHTCNKCGMASDAGRLYFSVGIHILADLMQQAYHSQSSTGPLDGPQGADVGTLLYFCTLREALLTHFLLQALRLKDVPESLVERLLQDNRLATQRFGKLFTSVVGRSWNEALERVAEVGGNNFRGVSELMRRAASIRNRFLHEGTAWEITREQSTECINSAGQLVAMFVALHNEYARESA